MSKGSNRRPSQIKKSDFDDRWDSTFGPVKRDRDLGAWFEDPVLAMTLVQLGQDDA